jgi:hypothetical protein
MEAVGAVDVGLPRRTKYRGIAGSWTGKAVGGRIIRGVSLCLDDEATDLVNEQRCPNEIMGSRHGILVKEQRSNALRKHVTASQPVKDQHQGIFCRA